MKWKHLDLFSGIMGFSLGLERTGKYRTEGFCEIEPYCQALIMEKKPSTPCWPDITKLNDYLERALILLRGDSLARILVSQEKEQEYSVMNPPEKPAIVLDCFGRSYAPFAWFDQKQSCWRTWQKSITDGWALYSERWPKAGMTRNGIAYRRAGLEGGICDKDSTPYPTPTASDHKGASLNCKKLKNKEISMLRYFLHYHYAGSIRTSYPHPEFVEHLMGYQTGCTELKAAGTQSILKSLKSWAKQSQKASAND